MSQPRAKIEAFQDRAREFSECCRTFLPGADDAAGRDITGYAPIWLFHLAESASQVILAYGTILEAPECLRYISRRHVLAHAINQLHAALDRLMVRWGWLRSGDWPTWWGGFLEGLAFTPEGKPRFGAPGIPSYIPIRIAWDDRGKPHAVVALPDSRGGATPGLPAPQRNGSPRLAVSDATRPGGPNRLLVLFSHPSEGVDGFWLVNPSVPTITTAEAAAMEAALALVDSAIDSPADQPAGPLRVAPVIRDDVTERRDRRIYDECCRITKYKTILIIIKK